MNGVSVVEMNCWLVQCCGFLRRDVVFVDKVIVGL